MGDLVYLTNVSLDGYIEDTQGALDWAPPDDEVFAATTAHLAEFGTYFYGRRLYEAMSLWETDPLLAERSELTAEFARVWQAADKVVHSTTLDEPWTANTRLERTLDADVVRKLKASSERDLIIGGADLAAQALALGLVDEYRPYVWPVVLGGGKPALSTGVRAGLELLDHHRFDNGALHLRYRVTS